jgi:hypothetical protein
MWWTCTLVILSVVTFVETSTATVRVSKALGEHGYGALRLSVIDTGDNNAETNSHFTYNEQFKHRWTDKWLHSVLVTNLTAAEHSFPVSNASSVTISLPAEGAGVKGIIFGDPCTEPGFVGCIHFNDTTNMSTRLTRLVNALSVDTDFRVIVGDNFYDNDGAISSRFFSKLSPRAQSRWQVTIPGNHDFW